MGTKYTFFFDEIDKKDLSLVGGKGANLGEMTKAGFPVPYGYCVTTEAYKEFIKQSNLFKFISEAVKDANLDNISQTGEKIRKKICESAIPKEIELEIIKAFNETGTDNYYAVRSSATAEDLAFASFAGQQDTYLNIKGESSLLDSVRKCWASLFTDRAILYRIQNNIEHEKVQMSVVVQKMVLPEVSGIMFTADPVSGHRGIISIDAGYGLGEALVSGLVSPDIYKFRKHNKQVASKTIAHKKLAIMPLSDGGTERIEITGERSKSQVMDENTIMRLAELAMDIENHYGCPQDIEWCIEKGEFFIVQSRAITSLFPLPAPQPEDDALHAYVSFNHFQVMTNPISPLGIDILRIILPFDHAARSEDDYKYVKTAAGRIYIDLSELLQSKRLRKGIPGFLKNVDALLGDSLAELVSMPDFEVRIKKNRGSSKALRKILAPIVINTVQKLTYKRPEDSIPFMNNYIEKRVRKVTETIGNANPGIERLEAIYNAANFLEDFMTVIPIIAPGVASFKALEKLEQKFLGTRMYVDTIVKGLEGNITTEMGLLVGDLADMIRNSYDLSKEFKNEDYKTLILRVNNLNGHDEFKAKFNTFMDIYDMRAAGEIDIAKDRWIENPEPLAKSIMAIVETSREGVHRKDYENTIARAKEAADKLIKEIEEKHGKIKGKIARRLIRVLRYHLPTREHPKYMIMKFILVFKKVLLEEAGLLVEKGLLAAEKDIFHVSFWELYNSIKNDTDLKALVEVRKEEYAHYRKLNAPRVLTNEGEEIKAGYKAKDLPMGALAGMPVSSGVIEGIARVITDPSNSSIKKGEILIAPFTDPGWTPLFINAAGLVMEVGGLLTHGTVVAREYGIPAVVGITGATNIIKTGQRIRVDGNAGYVQILEDQAVL